MTQDELRRAVARDATAHVVDDASIGVISDAMANFFIDELAKLRHRIAGAVAWGGRTAERPNSHRIPGEELDHCVLLPICVDGVNGVPIRRYANDSALDAEFTILQGGQPESMRCCTSD